MANPRARKQSKLKPVLSAHLLPILIGVMVILFGLFGSDIELWLRFDRNGILSGEIWRLFTGHFAHLSWTHLLTNLLGLALVWGLFGHHLPAKRWIHVIAFNALGISLLMLVIGSQFNMYNWYVGLSGVLHGMFLVGCLYDMRTGRWDSKILLALLIGKLIWEQVEQLSGSAAESKSIFGQLFNLFLGGPVLVDAHLFGALMGLITYLVFRRIEGRQTQLVTPQHS